MADQTQRLNGKVAIVTGAGRGIGKAIAIAYAREGASVCCAARTSTEIEETVREIEGYGERGLAIQTDVTQMESVRRMFEATVEEFGGLDILVANAGGAFELRHVEDSDLADWLTTLQVNLVGAYYCAKTAIPYLKRRGAGKIITIGSGHGRRSQPGHSAYACSKAGLWMLTRVLAQELWQYNISVNELIPGPVLTRAAREAIAEREGTVFNLESEWVKGPADVTPLAVFLATQPDRGPTAQSYSLMRRDS